MNKQEHLLLILEEECLEVATEFLKVAHNISKALRFGLNEPCDVPSISNREWIEQELDDVRGALRKLEQDAGVVFHSDPDRIQYKTEKIERYMQYAKQLGLIREARE